MRDHILEELLVLLGEERELVTARIVLQHGPGIRGALLREKLLVVRHQARDAHLGRFLGQFALGNQVREVRQLASGEVLHLEPVLVQRVRRQVHAHEFLLLLQEAQVVFLPCHFRHRGPLGLHFLDVAEQGGGRIDRIVPEQLAVPDDLVDERLSAAARELILAALDAETVQRAGVQERLERLAVDDAAHPLHEVVNVRV